MCFRLCLLNQHFRCWKWLLVWYRTGLRLYYLNPNFLWYNSLLLSCRYRMCFKLYLLNQHFRCWKLLLGWYRAGFRLYDLNPHLLCYKWLLVSCMITDCMLRLCYRGCGAGAAIEGAAACVQEQWSIWILNWLVVSCRLQVV